MNGCGVHTISVGCSFAAVARAMAAVLMRGYPPVQSIHDAKTVSTAASTTSLSEAATTNKQKALLYSPRNHESTAQHAKSPPLQHADKVPQSAPAPQADRFQMVPLPLQSSLPSIDYGSMRFRSTPTLLQNMSESHRDSYHDPARMAATTMTASFAPPCHDNPGLVSLLCSGSTRSTALATTFSVQNYGAGQCQMPRQQHQPFPNGDTLQSMWPRIQSSTVPPLLSQSTMLQPFPAPMSYAFVHYGDSTALSMEPSLAAYSYCHQMYRHLERPLVTTMDMTRRQQSYSMTVTIPLPSILGSATDTSVMSDHQVLMRLQIEIFCATIDDVTSIVKGRNRRIHVGQVGIRCRHCAHLSLAQRGHGTVYFPSTTFGIYQAAQNMSTMHTQCGRCPEMPNAIKQRFVDLLPTKNVNSKVGRKYWAERAIEMFGLVDTESGIMVQAK
jgi:hypothetical protein